MTAVGFAPFVQKSSREGDRKPHGGQNSIQEQDKKCDGSAMNSGSTLATVRSYDWFREGLEGKPVPKRQTRRTTPFASK